MTNTKNTKAEAATHPMGSDAEAPSVITLADAAVAAGGAASMVTLASLLTKASPSEARYITGLAAEAEASKLADSMVYRLTSGQTIGLGVLAEVRERFNTGAVTKADGTVADALASDAIPSDASVRLALGLNAEGSKYPVAPGRLVGRSDVQRYTSLAKCEASDIDKGWAASLAAGTERDYTKTVAAVIDAKAWRTDATTAAEAAKAKAEREAEREEAAKAAKAAKDEATKAEEAAKAVPSPVAIDPTWTSLQLRSLVREANAALTLAAKAEAEASAKAEAEAEALAKVAEAAGLTVDALRDMLAAKAVAA